jgi:hypothetical protein
VPNYPRHWRSDDRTEHYREAERIITKVSAGELDSSVLDRDQLLIAAQVHALLASAAATAVSSSALDGRAWADAEGTRLSDNA